MEWVVVLEGGGFNVTGGWLCGWKGRQRVAVWAVDMGWAAARAAGMTRHAGKTPTNPLR